MSSTVAPFLYQTRTIQRALRRWPTAPFARLVHSSRGSGSSDIPFDWGGEAPVKDYGHIPRTISDMNHKKLQSNDLTLSPNEAHIFKRIFEEIAEGKMPPPKRRGDRKSGPKQTQPPQSLVEHARMTEFRDKTLERFPQSLRVAADKALGLFEMQSSDEAVPEVSEEDKALRAERQRYTQIREQEKRRVENLMRTCQTDFELWEMMEKEVFSLPLKLGLVPQQRESVRTWRRGKPDVDHLAKVRQKKQRVETANARAAEEDEANKDKYIMDVHGALYSHYLLMGLRLFDSRFSKPSLFAFQILPRVKKLGLTSYVLGASTPFYEALATMHWERYGDATSALDAIQEMNAAGLYANEDVNALLGRMREHLTVCSLGVQGPFVGGMTEAPPYDGELMERVEAAEDFTRDMRWEAKH